MIIDSHCHLHDAAYADTRQTVEVARAHGVWGTVAVGCDPASNERTMAAAAGATRSVWPCLGFHPDWPQLTDEDLDRVEGQVAEHHPRLAGLGEIGLPWYSLAEAADPATVMTRGRARLERLLGIAARWDLPVALHAPHGAAVQAFEALRRKGIERAVFHWHKAPADVTRAIVAAGYHVSVSPEVVYRDRDREMVAAVPLGSLLVESDGPWPYRGEFENLASGPWLASRVAEEVAKLKRMPVDDVMHALTSNACALFDLAWL
jgi:TatD DNase family protein